MRVEYTASNRSPNLNQNGEQTTVGKAPPDPQAELVLETRSVEHLRMGETSDIKIVARIGLGPPDSATGAAGRRASPEMARARGPKA